jgi:hypothetical protein
MDPIARSAAQRVARNTARLASPAPQEREASVVDVEADALVVDIEPDNSIVHPVQATPPPPRVVSVRHFFYFKNSEF